MTANMHDQDRRLPSSYSEAIRKLIEGLGIAFVLWCACPLGTAQERPAKSSLAIQHAEAFIQQGQLDEAKAAVLDELKRTPASVEGYNLLGIIESDQQDYSNALAAF